MARPRLTPVFRPMTTIRCSPRSLLAPAYAQQHRLYAGGSSYGGGEGDPKGENPSDQGSNPSADLEHPGPPPPSVGQGTGGGPTKGGAQGHNTQQNESSSSGGQASTSGSGGASGGDGPQPKIHKHNAPEEHTHSDEVRAHNEDMAKRHDRPNEKSADKEDKVDKGYWSGHGGADRKP
ncbi:MAG: hypothetical protein Q9175_005076 [Cornicularia normoerica]